MAKHGKKLSAEDILKIMAQHDTISSDILNLEECEKITLLQVALFWRAQTVQLIKDLDHEKKHSLEIMTNSLANFNSLPSPGYLNDPFSDGDEDDQEF